VLTPNGLMAMLISPERSHSGEPLPRHRFCSAHRSEVTTTASAASFIYDAPASARVGVHESGAAEVSPRLSVAREESALPSAEAWGAPTTLLTPRNATEAAGGLADDALSYATRAEKLDHMFVPKHNLDPLVQQLGSREAVVEQMLGGVKGLTPTSGTFVIPVTIGGQTVVVRGAVVDGVVKLGTAFTP
jgi:hypothetical protein